MAYCRSNAVMNRAQKRKSERDTRRGIDRSDRVVSLPPIIDEFTVFDIPQRIFDQISNGSVDAINDIPVFRDNTGELCEVIPALDGWIHTWTKITIDLHLGLGFTSMSILVGRLRNNRELSVIDIAAAKCELNACRKAFRTCNRAEIMSIAKTAQIQIMLETA